MRAPVVTLFALCLALSAAACGPNPKASGAANLAAPLRPVMIAGPTDAEKAKALAALPPAYRGGDLDKGEARFVVCRPCHTVARYGANGVGPNLYGVFGRRAGTLPGFSYSDALKGSKIVWTAGSLDRWIENPRRDVPGVKTTYAGMENARSRIDVIAYLAAAATPTER